MEHTKDNEQALEYDLTAEQLKTAHKYTRTGTRKPPIKAPTVYKFDKPKERKPDATKEELVTALQQFLTENPQFAITEVQVVNPTRQLNFRLGDYTFDLTLIRNSKGKKGKK